MQSPLNARIGRKWPSPSLRCPPERSSTVGASSVLESRRPGIKPFYVGALLVAGAIWWLSASTLRIGDVALPLGLHDSTPSRDRPLTQFPALGCGSPARQ